MTSKIKKSNASKLRLLNLIHVLQLLEGLVSSFVINDFTKFQSQNLRQPGITTMLGSLTWLCLSFDAPVYMIVFIKRFSSRLQIIQL